MTLLPSNLQPSEVFPSTSSPLHSSPVELREVRHRSNILPPIQTKKCEFYTIYIRVSFQVSFFAFTYLHKPATTMLMGRMGPFLYDGIDAP